MEKIKLSIYMIVKDEEEMIEDALKSIAGADEIVVCIDDRTTDRTRDIVKKYTAKIFDFKWQDDFSGAKNEAASHCSGEWLMSLDADLRLEEGGIEKIRQIIETTKLDVVDVVLEPIGQPNRNHFRGKIYRNNGKIFYVGRAHEDLNVYGKPHEGGIMPKIYWGYSKNHFKDPDRYIRILTKQLQDTPNHPRYLFYLAREFYYKKQYEIAIEMFKNYLKFSTYPAEKAEAYIMLAEMYWWTQQGEKAREMCGQAIIINPDFKRALQLMSEMHFEPNKSKWAKIASYAQNQDVMFKR